MEQLGQFLIEQGAISPVELEESLRFQAVYGGQIGTCLIDLGFVALHELAAYLSDFHGVPLPPREWTEHPDERAIHVVPMPLIRRCTALPLKLEQSRIHVAMLHPNDMDHREFISMAAGRPVEPYVLPERELVRLLEVHLGVDRHPRFLGMITRPRTRGMSEEEAESSTPLLRARRSVRLEEVGELEIAGATVEAPQAPARPSMPRVETSEAPALDESALEMPDLAIGLEEAPPVGPAASTPPSRPDSTAAAEPPPAEEILLLDQLVATPEVRGDGPPSQPPPREVEEAGPGAAPSSRIANLEAQLNVGSDRDEIIRLGLEIARSYASAVALFVVRADMVSGFGASGPGMDPRLTGIEIPLDTPSVFTHLAMTRMPFRGAAPVGGIDARLVESLGRSDVQEIFVHPVIIRDRTVNLLYADNGPDAFGDTSIAALTALCDCLANAYERLIAERKRRD